MTERGKLVALVVLCAAARAVSAATSPLLAGEAYYWLWHRHLAAGYFDHPPMVAVLARICFGWVDANELAARSGAVLAGALTIPAVHLLAREMFPGTGTAWRAALLFAVTPVFVVLGMLLVPDCTLLLAMTLTWWAMWRAVTRGGLGWWVAAGAAAGVALLSKFHAWVLLPPLLGFLVVSRARRPLLRTPGPWLAVVAALVVVSPNLMWNARNGWINYAFQWRRSAIPEADVGSIWVHVFLAVVVLGLGPGLAWALVRAAREGFRRARADDRMLFLLCAGLPLPLFLGLLSFGVKISVHWPSAGYVPLLVLAAYLGEPAAHVAESTAHVAESTSGVAPFRITRWAWGGAIALAVVAHVAPPIVLRVLPPEPEPAERTFSMASVGRVQGHAVGWREIAAVVHEERALHDGPAPVVVFGDKWTDVSMLAFHTGLTGDCFARESDKAHNFELWRAERGGLRGASAVVVHERARPNRVLSPREENDDARELRRLFDQVTRRPSLVLYADGTHERTREPPTPSRPRMRTFEVYRCTGFRGEIQAERR